MGTIVLKCTSKSIFYYVKNASLKYIGCTVYLLSQEVARNFLSVGYNLRAFLF